MSQTPPLTSACDSGVGLQMLVVFTGACLIVTGAVAMLALIDSWWVLGLAFGVHIVMTSFVGFAVFNALADGPLVSETLAGPPRPDADKTDRLEVSAPARIKPREAHPAGA